VVSTNGLAVAVSYGLPTVTGGTAPVTMACIPASGSPFNVGSTTVACTATDAVHRANSCTFSVTVSPPAPHLSVTRILAFGDSITEGEVPLASEFGLRLRLVMPGQSYPADLTSMLAQRYTAQGATRIDAFTFDPNTDATDCKYDPSLPVTSGIVVINAGCLGATAVTNTLTMHDTLGRLMDKIATYHPDLMLLHLGVNDLDPDPEDANTSIANALAGVQQLIQYARSQGVRVMVGTLLPEIAGLPRAGVVGLIPQFNSQLAGVASTAGAMTVVDLYTDINADKTDWISPYDGLHPTVAGYQEIAKVWFNAIKSSAFDSSQSPTPTATTSSLVRLPSTALGPRKPDTTDKKR
jgi:lysophospholipase L1-like esterase